MELSPKALSRLKNLEKVESLIKQAKEHWNPVAASSLKNEAMAIIEQESVGILKDAIIVIDQFEQGQQP